MNDEILSDRRQAATLPAKRDGTRVFVAGLAYWYAVTPFHGIVFKGMLHGIRRAAESDRGETRAPTR